MRKPLFENIPWVPLASLVATPFVVFISSSHGLYLNNQSELDYQYRVLEPFLLAFCLVLTVGVLLYPFRRNQVARRLLCAYYLTGPLYLVFLFLQTLPLGNNFFLWVFDTPGGLLAYLSCFAWAVYRFGPRFDPKKVSGAFALFAVLLVVSELHAALTRLEWGASRLTTTAIAQRIQPRRPLPNVYHLVMDAFQSDYFNMILDDHTRSDLGGFVYFPETRAVYELTRRSLPSIFSGRFFHVDMPWVEYQRRAMNSRQSFLYWLKRRGYTTIAYSPQVYTFQTTLFDYVIRHEDNPRAVELLGMNKATFERLWLYASVPRFITRWMMDTDWFVQYGVDQDMRLMKNERFLAYSRPIESYFSFLNFLDEERYLPASGRYTFIHLLIPHPPEVFDAQCAYTEQGEPTDPLAQAQCAVKLIRDFVKVLKGLGRFENSLIIIQGDHGNFYRYENGRFLPTEDVSLRALLLIKPLDAAGPFRVSSAKATLLDIAPTLLRSLAIDNDLHFDGSVLGDVLAPERTSTPASK